VGNPECLEPSLPRLEFGAVDDPEGEMVQAGPVLVEAVVPVGAQVVEAGGGIGEQVPDDHQDGTGHSEQGFALGEPGEACAGAREIGSDSLSPQVSGWE
jgi:hypothetical protein